MTPTKTFLTADHGQRLASAITHIANGLMLDPNTAPGAMMARELVSDLAQPKPSPVPAPSCDAPHCACDTGEDCHANGAAEAVRPAWTLCRVDEPGRDTMLKLSDGHEVIEFWVPAGTSYNTMKEGLHLLIGMLHDGPVSSCATPRPRSSEDCAANGAGDSVQPAWWTDHKSVALGAAIGEIVDVRFDKLMAAIRELSDRTKPGTLTLDGATIDLGGFLKAGGAGVTVLGDDGTRIQTAPPAPDLAARLDGLKASVDALAERLDGKAGDGGGPYMPRAPRLVHTVEVSATVDDASQLGDVWWIKPHPAVALGALICEGEGGDPMEVVDFHELLDGELSVIVKPAKEV